MPFSLKHMRRAIAAPCCVLACVLAATSCGLRRNADDGSTRELARLAMLPVDQIREYLEHPESRDVIADRYAKAEMRERVRGFFVELAGSETIADAILSAASDNGVRLSLAFALAHEESRFKPGAMNRNPGSVDRGLFQLNSRSFPDLSEADAFDPVVNASTGLAYLRSCLVRGGNEVAALAMYNAGHGRVSGAGTPAVTLDYIHRIQNARNNIERLFEARVIERELNHPPVRLSFAAAGFMVPGADDPRPVSSGR